MPCGPSCSRAAEVLLVIVVSGFVLCLSLHVTADTVYRIQYQSKPDLDVREISGSTYCVSCWNVKAVSTSGCTEKG